MIFSIVSDNLTALEREVQAEDTPFTRISSNTSASTIENKPNLKFEKVDDIPPTGNAREQKWKSNSLTKPVTSKLNNVAGSNNLYRNNPQRLCSSEHSSPQTERRKDQIISSNHTNGEQSSISTVMSTTNINEKTNVLMTATTDGIT